MALTKVSRGLLSTGIVDNSNATAITIDSSENVTFVGGVTTTGLAINGGGSNIQATLTSTDTVCGIKLVDNNGNVELSAAGNVFQVQPAGGTATFKVSQTDISTPTAGTDNVRLGENAGNSIIADNAGVDNVLIGTNAGTAITSGDSNVAIGKDALMTEDAHANNVAIGAHALRIQNAGADAYNVAVGYHAGAVITTGIKNTLMGGSAGDALTDADNNVAIGYEALTTNQLGSSSVAIGTGALAVQNPDSAASMLNMAVGHDAGVAVTTGIKNAFGGASAGESTTTGSQNTFFGMAARGSGATVSNEIVVGFNQVARGAGTVTFGTAETFTSISLGGTSLSGSSDERLKNNITSSTAGLAFINDLRPVTYDWKNKGDIPSSSNAYVEGSTERFNDTDKVLHGFIAQEVKAVIDDHAEIKSGHGLWKSGVDGIQEVAPAALIPMLVKAIQEQSALITALTARITTLEG